MKAYVIIQWFYDGDSFLVNSFIDIKRSYDEAKKTLKETDIILSKDDFEEYENKLIPKEWGGYMSSVKYEIREIKF